MPHSSNDKNLENKKNSKSIIIKISIGISVVIIGGLILFGLTSLLDPDKPEIPDDDTPSITVGPNSTVGNIMISGPGDDLQIGGPIDDILHPGSGNNVQIAGSGNDSIYSGNGSNIQIAGSGNDTIYSPMPGSIVFGDNPEYEEIVELMDDGLIESEAAVELFITIGKHHNRQGNFDEAEKNINHALVLAPNNPKVLYEKAIILYFKYDDSSQAFNLLNFALTLDPKNRAELINLKGLMLYNNDEYDKALDLFYQVLLIYPDPDLTLYYIGHILYAQSKYEESIFYLGKSLDINPKNKLALVYLGMALNNIGKYNESVNSLKQALDLNPDDDLVKELLEVALENKNRFDRMN